MLIVKGHPIPRAKIALRAPRSLGFQSNLATRGRAPIFHHVLALGLDPCIGQPPTPLLDLAEKPTTSCSNCATSRRRYPRPREGLGALIAIVYGSLLDVSTNTDIPIKVAYASNGRVLQRNGLAQRLNRAQVVIAEYTRRLISSRSLWVFISPITRQ